MAEGATMTLAGGAATGETVTLPGAAIGAIVAVAGEAAAGPMVTLPAGCSAAATVTCPSDAAPKEAATVTTPSAAAGSGGTGAAAVFAASLGFSSVLLDGDASTGSGSGGSGGATSGSGAGGTLGVPTTFVEVGFDAAAGAAPIVTRPALPPGSVPLIWELGSAAAAQPLNADAASKLQNEILSVSFIDDPDRATWIDSDGSAGDGSYPDDSDGSGWEVE